MSQTYLLRAVPALLGLSLFGATPVTANTPGAWTAMAESPPASAVANETRAAVLFPCHFATTSTERASWDLRTTLDLSGARGLRFAFRCDDPAPVSQFVAYFESPPGWYRIEFEPEAVGRWETIELDKTDARVEGAPGGWDQIRTVRVSAWRGQNRDTEFQLAGLEPIPARPPVIAILRSDLAGQPSSDEAKTVDEYVRGLADELRALDLPHEIVGDGAVTNGGLQRFRIVALPYNPSLAPSALAEVKRYAQAGGRVFACFTMPASLHETLGVASGPHVRQQKPGDFATIRVTDASFEGAPGTTGQRSWNINAMTALSNRAQVCAEWLNADGQPTGHAALLTSSNAMVMTHVLLRDDPANKRRLLMAILGRLAPALWDEAARGALAHVAESSGFASFDEAGKAIALHGGELDEARTAMKTARDALAAGHPAESIEQAGRASRTLLRAWCAAQKPQRDEFRAFWCHDAFGVSGMSWDEAIGRLATNGFTAIFPNMLWGGSAFYPSDVLPVAAAAQERGDQIAACVAAARKHGVQVHVWKVNWNLGYTAPKAFIERMRSEHRLQMNAKGEELAWLCPSHPDNQKLEIAAMVEVARKYDVDGIHFDYIRYPDNEHCFCAGCRERFATDLGAKIDHWPADVLGKGSLRQRWLGWRRGNITAVVKATSEQARALKPKLKISAAVFRNWTTDRDGVGQDWKLWCDKGWVDFVCPMDYTESNQNFETMVTAQKTWAGSVPVYPGIGVSASSSRFGAAKTIEQISITRKHQTGGFIIFNYGENESRTLLPQLGAGITRRE